MCIPYLLIYKLIYRLVLLRLTDALTICIATCNCGAVTERKANIFMILGRVMHTHNGRFQQG